MSAERAPSPLVRRSLAFAVLAPLILLLVIEGPGIWDALAYREPVRDLGFEYRPKRWSWLPGPSMRIPKQPCTSCQADEHATCSGRTGEVKLRLTPRGPGISPSSLVPGGLQITGATLRINAPMDVFSAVSFSVNGVELSPKSFRCPCCPVD